jgi:ABC-type maltose transport system permease subunit
MDRQIAFALYIGLLLLDGAVIATRLFPQPLHLAVVVAVLVAAVIVRTRVLHAPSYSRIDLTGTAAMLLSYLATAFLFGRWPFR